MMDREQDKRDGCVNLFSIIVVTLNAGNKLKDTVRSILEQSVMDYEVIVKDGGSKDGSVEALKTLSQERKTAAAWARVKVYREADSGIYDAMNQAVSYASGEYFLFLNSGDSFYDKDVLKRVGAFIAAQKRKQAAQKGPCIYYGNVFEKPTGEIVASNPRLDAFACYRNIPCHQVCFYDRRLFAQRGYLTAYRVRADYEHFLWCYFVKRAETVWMPVAIASYEGGGFSETVENRRISAREHQKITKEYLTRGQRMGYRLILWLTLAPLRRRMAGSRRMAGIYQKIKRLLYRG